MKVPTSILAGLFFIGTIGAVHTATATDKTATAPDGVISKQELVADGYCHMKFPAIDEETLNSDHPILSKNDIIDFYGPCKEDPLGYDQIQTQKVEDQHRRDSGQSD